MHFEEPNTSARCQQQRPVLRALAKVEVFPEESLCKQLWLLDSAALVLFVDTQSYTPSMSACDQFLEAAKVQSLVRDANGTFPK